MRSCGAGATKPSLYRSFASKDELAAAYLRDWDVAFWQRFEAAVAARPDDRAGKLHLFLSRLAKRMRQPGYRGCGLTNAAIEYPEAGHPARRVAVANKRKLRRRLRADGGGDGRRQPRTAGDGLALLLEGAFVSCQLFRPRRTGTGAGRRWPWLIDAALPRRAAARRTGR
jgi:AcrR family transcriptional regulator